MQSTFPATAQQEVTTFGFGQDLTGGELLHAIVQSLDFYYPRLILMRSAGANTNAGTTSLTWLI